VDFWTTKCGEICVTVLKKNRTAFGYAQTRYVLERKWTCMHNSVTPTIDLTCWYENIVVVDYVLVLI